MWRRFLASFAIPTCWALAAAALNADVEIGVLTCSLSEPPEAPATEAPTGERTRDAVCTFKAGSGAEETYTGKIFGVSVSAEQTGTVIWVVRSPSQASAHPGALEQAFTSDSSKPPDQKPPLIGEGNAELALHSMSDRAEGSVSATEKPAPSGFVIFRLELKLKSTAG